MINMLSQLLRPLYAMPCFQEEENETLSIQTNENPREEKNCPTPVGGLKKVQLDGPYKVVQIGATLLKEQVEALTVLLIEFKEIFS